MSYAVQKISKTDFRYDLLLKIPKKHSSDELSYTFLMNRKHILFVYVKTNSVIYTITNFNGSTRDYLLL